MKKCFTFLLDLLNRFMFSIKRLIPAFCVLVFIAGCSSKENNGEPTVLQQVTLTTEPTSEPSIQPTVEPTIESKATPIATIESGFKTESLFNDTFKYSVKNPLPEHIVIENNEYEYGMEIQVSYKRNNGSCELIVTYYVQDNLMGYSSDGAPIERLESEAKIKKDGYYVFENPENPYIEGIDFSQYSDVIVFE